MAGTATELGEETERALRDLGYEIITDNVDFNTPPPPGTVYAKDGELKITVYPNPDEGTIGFTGSADCLPVS